MVVCKEVWHSPYRLPLWEIRADGKFVQKATEAEAALGTFVWWCAENQIEDLKGFINFTERGYVIDHWRSMQHLLIFSRLSK